MAKIIILRSFLLLVGLTSVASQKVDLAFLLDSWPNVDKSQALNGESVKDLLRNIYGSFSIGKDGVHVGLVKAGTTSTIEFDFNTFKDLATLDEAIDDVIFPDDPSRLGKAIDLANYGLFRNSGRSDAVKILVVIAKNKSSDDVSRAARDLRNSGVNILSVGLGQGLYGDDLKNIVSPPEQYNALFGNYSSLGKLGPNLVKRIQNFADSGIIKTTESEQDGSNDLKQIKKCSKKCVKEVEGGEKIPINCKNCKLAECCDMCCNNVNNAPVYSGPIQLGFLLDESGEMKNWNNFEAMKNFMKKLTHQFDISDKKTKLTIISFSRDKEQIYDLHSFHDHAKIDNQIDKLNYEATQTYSGPLNKGLDASQTNLFSEPRDLSVPRVLVVFDSATVKDDQTEVKAFKLQASDVQTFCIGLGMAYDKKECDKMVEKPVEKHSLAAQVTQLNELREAIMLMIVNDISEKYCPYCGQGLTDACRPCNAARNYIGKESTVQSIKPSDVLKIMSTFGNGRDGQNINLKSASEHKNENNGDDDDDDDDDNDDENKVKGVTNLGTSALPSQGGVQVGTPLPNVDLVKDLLQNGGAQDSDQNTQAPFLASNQAGSLQQNAGLLTQQALQQQQQTLPAPFDATQGIVNQNHLFHAPATTNLLPDPQASTFPGGNANLGGGMESVIQPVVLNPSLLNQAVYGAGKLQGVKKAKSKSSQRKHMKPDGPELKSAESFDSPLTLGAMSTGSLATPTFQAGPLNTGVTSSMPILPLAFRQQAEVQDSVLPQFQSLLPSATKLANPSGYLPAQSQDKKAPFVDEYKYDQLDQQGSFNAGCKDLSDECESYATEVGCDDWAPLTPFGEVKTMCKKSCGFCETNTLKAHKKSQTKENQKLRHKKPKKHHAYHVR